MSALTVIIPSYREEENLRVLLPRLKKTLAENSIDSEILIIDTMKPLDNTEQVCKEQNVKYFLRTPSNVYGDAVRTAIAKSNSEFILFMDADGSHAPEFIPKLWQERQQFDVVIGSRYVDGGDTENPPHLIWMSRLVNIVYSLILNLQCKDVSNSFKLYKTSQLKSLKLSCDNFDIIEEVLFKLNRQFKPLKIKEVPFTFKKRMFGDSKRNLFLFMITYVFTLIKLRFSR